MTCLLCGSDQHSFFARVESFGFPLVYYQCDRCGLIFQSEEESQAADPEFYAAAYREIYQSSEEPTAKDLWVQAQRAAHLVGLIKGRIPETPGRALDIGASAGVLLQAYQQAFGCAVTGVEPGDAYRHFAAQKGLQMEPSLEAVLAAKPERYDLVSLIHVMEHLPDPVGTLRAIREDLLARDGVLLVEVPNFYVHDSYEVAHLACYTPHTLRETIRQAGYEVVTMTRHGVPRSAMLNLYLTVIARPLVDGSIIEPVRRENSVQFRRQAGLLYRRVIQKLFPHRAWLPLNPGKDA